MKSIHPDERQGLVDLLAWYAKNQPTSGVNYRTLIAEASTTTDPRAIERLWRLTDGWLS